MNMIPKSESDICQQAHFSSFKLRNEVTRRKFRNYLGSLALSNIVLDRKQKAQALKIMLGKIDQLTLTDDDKEWLHDKPVGKEIL